MLTTIESMLTTGGTYRIIQFEPLFTGLPMVPKNIPATEAQIAEFCRRHHIRELSYFGSGRVDCVLLIFLSHIFLSVSSMVRRNWKGTDRKMSDRKICPL